MPRILAPRAVAASKLSSTSAPAPSAITKPSRFLENGLDRGLRRIVLGRQRRQQREPDQRLGIDRAIGCDAQRCLGLAAADCFDPELNCACSRCAGRRERDRRALGAEGFGEMVRNRAEQKAAMIPFEFAAAADPQHLIIVDVDTGPMSRPAPGAAAIRARPAPPRETAGRESRRCVPIAACAMASSVAMSASRSERSADENGSTVTKSTVPAIGGSSSLRLETG